MASAPTLLAGRYAYIREIGIGGGGRVLLAEDTVSGERRALKAVDSAAFAQLFAEWSALSRLEHPSLARAHELLRLDRPLDPPFGLPRGTGILVESFVDGVDADAFIADVEPASRERECVRVVRAVARAVAALHAHGVLHGDIKPANIVVGPAGPVLVDLGLAGPPHPADGRLRGTPGFIAPEGWLGERSIATDIFALGATLLRLLVGPSAEHGSFDTLDAGGSFQIPTVDALASHTQNAALAALVGSMLAAEVGDRPGSIHELLVRTQPVATALGLASEPTDGPSHAERALRARNVRWVGDLRERERLVAAMRGPVAWVHGPPGSGRTRFIAEAVRELQRVRAAELEPVPTYVRDAASTLADHDSHPRVHHVLGGDHDALAREVRAAGLAGHCVVVESNEAAPEWVPDHASMKVGPLDDARLKTLVEALLRTSTDSLVRAAKTASGGLAGRLCRVVAAHYHQGEDPAHAEVLTRRGDDAELALPAGSADLARRLAVSGGALHPETLGDASASMGLLLADGLAFLTEGGRVELRRDVLVRVLDAMPVERRANLARSLRADDARSRAYQQVHADPDDAITAFEAAIDEAAAAGELATAEQLAVDGLSLCAEPGSLADRLALVRLWAGRYAAAAAVVRDPALAAEVARRAGRADDAWRLLKSVPATIEGDATRAWLHLSNGELAEADAVAPASPAGLEVRAWTSLGRGDEALAEEQIRQALSANTDPRMAARLTSSLGSVLKARGDLEGASSAQRAARDQAASLGMRHLAATAGANLGAVLFDLGYLGRAVEVLRTTAQDQLALGRDRDVARSLFNLAFAERAAGQGALARAHADVARDAAARSGDLLASQATAALDALFAIDDGRTADALRRAEAIEGEELRSVVALELAPHDAVGAGSLLTGAEGLPMSALARAAIAFARGDLLECRARLERAETYPLSWFERLRAHLLRAASAPDRGVEDAALSRARELLDRAGRDLPPEARARFRRVPVYAPAQAAARVPGRTSDGRRWRRLGALSKRFASEHHLGRLRDEVARAALELVEGERASLVERSSHGELRVLCRIGHGEDAVSRSIVARALDSGDVVVAVDASKEGAGRSAHALALRSVVCVPLPRRPEVLYLDDRARPAAFDDEDRALLTDLADLASIALTNAELLRAGRREAARLLERERELARQLDGTRAELESLREPGADGIVFVSDAMSRVMSLVSKVARSDLPVLIRGESGTGKELVARVIRDRSARASAPFIRENCGAIPDALLESALFGHARGAFTGAHESRVGLFEAADGGTLFLDEVGEMSAAMQAKLLRVVQDGEVRRLGGEDVRRVDVRLLTATHRDLEQAVAEGSFREDLYYRLAVVTVAIPPLRERREDIAPLVQELLARHRDPPPRVSAAAMACLQSNPWPGNVRQLDNELRRALVLCEDVVDLAHLTPELHVAPSETADAFDFKGQVAQLEAKLIVRALETTEGNVTRAAELLGLSRYGLQKMMKRLGVER